MMTTQELAAMAVRQMTEGREAILREAINHAMGRTNWLPEKVAPRSQLVFYGPTECVFLFDKVPLVEFDDVKLIRVEGETVFIRFTQQFRRLYAVTSI